MRTVIFILILTFYNICKGQTRDEEIQNLKKAAFCQCIYKSFENDSILISNEGSASAYIETGNSSIESYVKVFSSANEYLESNSKNYVSKHGNSLAIMMCVDFLYSEKLDSLVREIVGQ